MIFFYERSCFGELLNFPWAKMFDQIYRYHTFAYLYVTRIPPVPCSTPVLWGEPTAFIIDKDQGITEKTEFYVIGTCPRLN